LEPGLEPQAHVRVRMYRYSEATLTQETLMAQAAIRLRTADDTHLATHTVAITTFAVDSFVLVQYSSAPPM
jgi:hypothetical protein